MRIQHNIAALNSYRQLGNNNNSVSKNLEKLSSGYRINRAGDDAAGLAISEKMRAQIKGLETAQKNANDGISLVQTAEGALTEVHSMLNRMVELATQSANGTYDNDVDRNNLQKEVKSLLDEIDRISESTNYNGINLLDGSLGGGVVKASGIELTGKNVSTFSPAKQTGGGSIKTNLSGSGTVLKPGEIKKNQVGTPVTQTTDVTNTALGDLSGETLASAATNLNGKSLTIDGITVKFVTAGNATDGAKDEVIVEDGMKSADFMKKVEDNLNAQAKAKTDAALEGTSNFTGYSNYKLSATDSGALSYTRDITEYTGGSSKAVYEMDFTGMAPLKANEKINIGGMEIEASSGGAPGDIPPAINSADTTIADQLEDIVTILNDNTDFSSKWVASQDGDKLIFTAKEEGAIDPADVPQGPTITKTAIAADPDVAGAAPAVKAEYSYTIADAFEAGDTITLFGKDYVAGVDFAAGVDENGVAITKEAQAGQIAKLLSANADFSNDWDTVTTATDSNKIKFVAKTGGIIGGPGPDEAPAAMEIKKSVKVDQVSAGSDVPTSLSADPVKAVYEYDLSGWPTGGSALAAGDKLSVAGTTVTVAAGAGDDTTIGATAATADQKAQLAGALNADKDFAANWTASYDSDNDKLVLTAKNAGAIGGTGPAEVPAEITKIDAGGDPNSAVASAVEVTEGKEASFTTNLTSNAIDTFTVDGKTFTIDWSKGDAKSLYDQMAVDQSNQTEEGFKEMASKLTDLFNKEMKAQGVDGSVKISADKNGMFSIESTNGGASSSVGWTGNNLEPNKNSMGQALFGNVKGEAGVEEAGKKFGNTVTTSDTFTMTINGTTVEVGGITANRGDKMEDVAASLESAIQAAVGKYNDAMNYQAGNDEYLDPSKFKVEVDKTGGFKVGYEGDVEGVDFTFGEKTTNGVEGTAASLLGLAGTTSSSMTGGNGLSLQVGDTAADYNKVTVSIDSMSAYSLGIKGINIGTQEGASAAIDKIKKAINTVSSTRGDLGAIQNRLEHTINNLGVTTENMTAAESRIRDVDMAKEMMDFTKNNILVQASQAMLAQANQIPQGVLQLLQ